MDAKSADDTTLKTVFWVTRKVKATIAAVVLGAVENWIKEKEGAQDVIMNLWTRKFYCLAVVAGIVIAAPIFLGGVCFAEEEELCFGAMMANPVEKPPRYAPDRRVDILDLAIDVTPDFENRTVSDSVTIRFAPIATALDELRLDGIELDVESVKSNASIEAFQATEDEVTITFAKPIEAGEESWVSVAYSASPKSGLYFRTPKMGYRQGDAHLFTQGETHQARHWYPMYDYPNEKFTSEVTARVPRDMTVVSNGKMMSEQMDATTGLKVVRWRQDKPHVNYLIAFVAGYFKKIEESHGDIPVTFYTPASQIAQAKNSLRGTAVMIAFFEKEIGIDYPWSKYAQVAVNDFVVGGMENTNLTILTDSTLFTDATENIRSSQGLVAHELAHQ